MSDKSQSIKSKLIKLQNLLNSQSGALSLSQCLNQIIAYFNTIDLDNQQVVRNEVYDELKDTVKAIFAYLDRIKETTTQIAKKIQLSIKDLLIQISRFCSAFFYKYHPQGCAEMIKEFLSSECKLFLPTYGEANITQVKNEKQVQRENFIWAKISHFKSPFFTQCIEVILLNINNFSQKFQESRVVIIQQYMRLLYYMDDYIIKSKIEDLCVRDIDVLEKLFKNPSKEIMKDVTKEHLEQLINYLFKLVRGMRNNNLKERIGMLGALLGISMIRMPSIQKKIAGSKIINKFSYDLMYKSSYNFSDQFYCQWLINEGFFELIVQENCQVSIIKFCDDSLKILMKKGCISKQRFQKFFEILEKADSQLRKLMFRAVDTYRLDYSQIQILLQIFRVLRNSDFYDDEFFYFYEGISRYATNSQLSIMIETIEKILAVYYSTFTNHLIKRRGSECYAYIFEKITAFKDMEERLVAYKNVAQQFLTEPTESRLIMLKSLYKNISQSRLNYYYQQRLAADVVQDLQFIQKSIQYANNLILKQDLIYFIKFLLQKYKCNYNCKGFTKQDLIKSVDSAQIFEQMLKISRQSQVLGLLDDLCTQIKLKQFSFTCIRWAFIQLNKIHIKPIKKQYTDQICSYASIENIEQFKGVDLLIYLIFNSDRDLVRKGACQLLCQFATNFTSQFRSEAEPQLILYMKKMLAIIKIKIKQYLDNKGSVSSIYGSLQLIESFLLNTQYFGVGSLRAHNSHIPRSSVWLKIYNNCGIGDDTLKIFEKRFASNLTLFEVIQQVAEQFKIGPLDLGLEYPNFQLIKYHGLTLQQLTINGLELNAVKLPQSRCKTQPMILNGQLTQRAKIIFTQIFNKYAVQGIMGQKQCSNYIAGVTTTYCPINDSRISDLFYRYDTDKDDKINIQDFLRFYKDCIEDPIKLENVQKNLYNLHFRRDLKPYNAKLECNQQLLFRYHLFNDKQIYEFLFELSKHEDFQLSHLAQNILVRLPTYDKVTSSLANTFDLKGKNSFQIQYLLTALQTYLNNNKDASTDLISKGNHIPIFQYLSNLAENQNRSKNDQNCLIICLYILRTLLGDFNLKSFIGKRPQLTFQLPATKVFIKIISESIRNSDGTLLQPAFALQLTQDYLPTTLLQQAVFSKDKDTRVIACNFLYIWLLNGKGKDLNLFKITISPQNNEEWFNLLTIATHMDLDIDKNEIFNNCRTTVLSNSESLHGERYNPLINGCLKIIKQIYYKLDNQEKELLNKCLTQILPNLLSNQNRQIVYRLKENYPEILIQDLISITNINIGKQIQARNRFVGLRNLGCICYMNSILQQFFMIKSFYNFIMSLEAKKEESELNNIKFVDDFLAQLQEMYINLDWSQKQYYDPTKFCLAIKDSQGKPINTLIQQDAHEFLNTAFEKIEGYAKKQEKVNILEKLFGGKTVTEIICQTCKTKNEVLQDFYHLTVEVKGMKSLKESFDKFVQIEQIADYFCQSCNKKVEKITKQMLIKQSPSVLVINLQRIIFDLQIFLKVKVHTKLTFDQKLDLHNYFSSGSKSALYSLKGVVIHTGTSEGGHYYSLIKQEGKWYKFNDQTVTAFNQSDIGRQAFGGDDTTDYWGQQSSSTNAYILFYEKIQEEQQDQIEVKPRINTDLIEKVKQQNIKFTKQIQLMQPSFFATLNNLFVTVAKPYKQQNRELAKQIYLLYIKIVKHLVVNSQLKIQIFTQIKNNILELIQIFHQYSFSSLQQFSQAQVKEALFGNNQVSVRDLFGKVYGKMLRNIMQSKDQQKKQKGREIIDSILLWFSQESFLKNLHKSYQYFELIKQSIIYNRQIREHILQKDFLSLYCDILMGHDSILFGKQKKKVQFHYSQAIPITTIINYLFRSKFPTKQEYDQSKLTQNERKIFYSPSFYKKIMKSKLDIGILAPIIERLSYRNEEYSKMIAETLIIGMNSKDEIEDKNIIFINIKAFLLIEDEFTQERIKWVLGIPQLLNIGYSIPQYGLEISSESIVYSYVSTLLFITDEKFKPFLFTLFEKRKFFSSFSSYGALTFLQMVNESQTVRNYILQLPAPIYIFKNYFSWIEIFIHRVKNEEHYSLPIDKNILAEKLTKLMDQIKIKIADSPHYNGQPVNKYIIGKNAEIFSLLKVNQKQYSMSIYSHQTYTLNNKPTDKGNQSLPDHEFSFINSSDQNTAKFFVKGVEYGFEEDPSVMKIITTYSYLIKNELPLQITFKIPGFKHKIYLKPGDHEINSPYCEDQISKLIQIKVIHPPQQQKKHQQPKEQQIPVKNQEDQFFTTNFDNSGSVANNYFLEIECKNCTLVNFGREKCQLCQSDLLS